MYKQWRKAHISAGLSLFKYFRSQIKKLFFHEVGKNSRSLIPLSPPPSLSLSKRVPPRWVLNTLKGPPTKSGQKNDFMRLSETISLTEEKHHRTVWDEQGPGECQFNKA